MELENASAGATQDERILAALAHASVIIPLWGLIGAVAIWATQREKSRFVGFQALQGTAYQLTLFVGGLLGMACYMCAFLGTFLGSLLLTPIAISVAESATDVSIGVVLAMMINFFPFCIIGIFILVGLAFVLYGLYGAVRVLQGQDFRYAIIGSRLERYLSQGQTA